MKQIDIKTEEPCPICKNTYDHVSSLILHTESCKKKKGKSEDMNRATKLVRRLNKQVSEKLSDKLKASIDAKNTPTDELSLHSDETHPPRKRRCKDRNASADAFPADHIDGSDGVHEGRNIDRASTPIFFFLGRTI